MEVRPHLLLVLLCLLGAGAGAGMPLPWPPAPVPQSGVAAAPRPTPFGRTMSTVITVAISVFFFLLFFCAYINQCRLAENAAPQGANAAAAGAGASRRGKRGLDPAVVATFPIMQYREIKEHKIGRGVLECALGI
uniref:Uncharacterized protein n=1 Tax=Aegilops tauschii TaxID=37682 RepID=R7W362_AEGTA